jgi:hypothetical protein
MIEAPGIRGHTARIRMEDTEMATITDCDIALELVMRFT